MENLVLKSLEGYKKYLKIISIAFTITSFAVLLIFLSMQLIYENMAYIYERDCGIYDIFLKNVNEEELHSIKENKNVRGISDCFIRYESINEKEIPVVYSSNEEYLNYVPYDLIKGETGKKYGEIVTEPWFLRQLGIETEDMIGSHIQIGGKSFLVTGLITFTGYAENSELIPGIVAFSADKATDYLVSLENNSSTDIDAFLQNIQKDYPDILFSRNTDKQAAYENSDNDTSIILWIVAFIFFTSSMIFVYSILCFFTKRAEKNIQTMLYLGVSHRRISNSMYTCVLKRVLTINIFCALIVLVGEKYIASIIYGINSGYSNHFAHVIIYVIVLSTFELLVLLCAVRHIFKKICSEETQKENKIKLKAHGKRNKNPNSVYFRLARNNYKKSIYINLFVAITIALSITSVVAISSYFESVRKSNIDYEDIKYKISFLDDYLATAEEEKLKKEAIDNMLSDADLRAERNKLYFSTMLVNKSCLSKDFINYLCNFPDVKNLIDNKIVDNIPVPVAIIPFSDTEEVKQIELNNNKAVMFNKLYNMENVDGLKSNDDAITSLIGGDSGYDEYNLFVSECSLTKKLYIKDILVAIAVDDELFDTLSGGQGSSVIYVHGDVTDAYLYSFLKDVNGVKVETSQELVSYSESGMNDIMCVLAFLCIVCIFSVLSVFFTTSVLRIDAHSDEYARLIYIGIPFSRIVEVVGCETGILFLLEFMISLITSLSAFELIKKNAEVNDSVFALEFPVGVFVALVVAFVVIIVGALFLSVKHIYRVVSK